MLTNETVILIDVVLNCHIQLVLIMTPKMVTKPENDFNLFLFLSFFFKGDENFEHDYFFFRILNIFNTHRKMR